MFLDEKKSGEAKTEAFLSAAMLGITERERRALIQTLAWFESDKVRPNTGKGARMISETSPPPTMFAMFIVEMETDCGTSCCLLGFARHLAKDRNIFDGCTRPSHPTNGLFFPISGITTTDPKKGARALRSYLETGDPKWVEAMA